MLHALIMAGGSGTRFWPASRRDVPKQLLPLVDDRSMLRATVDRLRLLVPPERIWPSVGTNLVDAVRRELPEVSEQTYVVEPCQRNTAPCIGLAALLMLRVDRDAVMLVLPADHAIQNVSDFQRSVKLAERLVAKPRKQLVTFGIRPTYPAEGFGYIEKTEMITPPMGSFTAIAAEIDVYQVVRFREKPNRELAEAFIESGNFFWNSGMFVWRADVLVDLLRANQPEMVARLETIAAAHGTPEYDAVLAREFPEIKGISIDYAVMEHAPAIVAIDAPFDWDDVGGWQSIGRLRGTDDAGNTIIGPHAGVDTRDTIVRTTDDHLIATLGLENIIVVHTPDATLVADKRNEESIRKLVQLLKDRGWEQYL